MQEACSAQLVLKSAKKAFSVPRIALRRAGYALFGCHKVHTCTLFRPAVANVKSNRENIKLSTKVRAIF